SSPLDSVLVISINRISQRNAVDRATATALHDAFLDFERNDAWKVAILTGQGGTFCAGADLKAISRGEGNLIDPDMDAMGPMGPTRLSLSKPVIAAVEGFAVAGGLELACWCDLRVASREAQFGVLCRLRGVPLIDGGTVRLPPLIGLSRAMDLILTGRLVSAKEANEMGLVNYLAGPGEALDKALSLAKTIVSHPQRCMLNDRASTLSSFLGDQRARQEEGASQSSDAAPSLDPILPLDQTEPEGRFNIRGKMREDMRREFLLGLESLAKLQSEGKVESFLRENRQSK
ncbi:ClpP/crotonase, partial [Violaceomyces palustris]